MSVNNNTVPTEKPIIFAPETYQYDKSQLNEEDLPKSNDPIELFEKWFKEAKDDPTEMIPESCNVATCNVSTGRVSNRVLLLKEIDKRGFIIYSNWKTSKKAKDVESNKYVGLNFFWKNLQRQVRVEGVLEFVNRETTERYFKTRPKGSKIGAWSSPQSQVIGNRQELEELVENNKKKFDDVDDVPCPDFWGGVRIVPLEIEFWQGRDSRLHDRISYRRENVDDAWSPVRLAP